VNKPYITTKQSETVICVGYFYANKTFNICWCI